MSDLDMDLLLGAEDDEGRTRRRTRSSNGKGGRKGRRRRRRRNRGGFLAPMLAVIVLVGILGGGGYFGFLWVRDVMIPDDFTGDGTGEVTVEIAEGASASEVALTLEEKGVVASARAFTNAIDAAGKSSGLQPGEYKLRKGMAADKAVVLLDPKLRVQHGKANIPEGLRLSQVYVRLAEATNISVKEFEQAAKGLQLPAGARNKLEGYAFPATYEVPPKMTATEILQEMVDRHERAVDEADMAARAKRMGYTAHEMLTIASIVQAESGRPEDMPKVARVIYNRLDREPPMLLQMDSTTMYGLNKFGISASFEDIKSRSPYNTYQRPGLPPGPISNPGDHAIEAALNPGKGNWLFFVTTDPKNGITKFTDNETEFQQFVQEFNQNNAGN